MKKQERHGHTSGRPGEYATPEYRAWQGMIVRCTFAHRGDFKNYGGRGIKVCDRWLQSFVAFLEDMGPRPEGGMLDRKDNNGNYCPENCRWTTRQEQNRNKRSNVLVEWNGKSQCLAAWAEELGIPRDSLVFRLKHWTLEKAMTTPLKPDRRRKL